MAIKKYHVSKNLFNINEVTSQTIVSDSRYGVAITGVGTYTVNAYGAVQSNDYFYTRVKHSNNTWEDTQRVIVGTTITARTATLSEGDTLYVFVATEESSLQNAVAKLERWKPMVNVGNMSLPYEPFETDNLFDGVYRKAYIASPSFAYREEGASQNPYDVSIIVKVKPNTTYTIKKFDASDRFRIGSSTQYPVDNTGLTAINNNSALTEYTFTTDSNANYVVAYLSTDTESVQPRVMVVEGSTAPSSYTPYGTVWIDIPYRKYGTETETFTTLPHEVIGDGQNISAWSMKGNMTQSGTPTPSNPVYPTEVGEKTANLLDYSFFTSTRYVTVTPITNGVNLTGTYFAEINITLEVGTTYYMSWDENAISGSLYVCWRLQYTDDTYSTLTRSGVALTPTKEIAKVLFYVNSTNTQASVDITNIMLNTGSTALPYEPYGMYKIPISSNGVSYPIYLSEPLRKIGDVADSINSDGTVTRRIGKVDLGTLQWHLSSSYNGLCDTAISNMRIIGNAATGNAICTSFIEVNANSVTTTNYGFSSCLNSQAKPYINHTGFEGYTDAEFMEFLSGVYMWYVLGTAQTESFTAPSIPTTGTAESFDVDTTLKPSEVSLTYHGWHEHSDEKYVGG